MKRRKIIILTVISIALLYISISVTRINKYRIDGKLQNIDSIAVKNPQLALDELGKIKYRLLNDQEKAFYTIIKKQAQIDLGNLSQNDTLLLKSMITFLGTDDSIKIAHSFYLRGKCLFNEGYILEAASSLNYAIEYFPVITRDKLRYDIHSTLADVYNQNRLFTEEVAEREKAYSYALALNDTSKINNSLINLAKSYTRIHINSDSLIRDVLQLIYSNQDINAEGIPQLIRSLKDKAEFKIQLSEGLKYVDRILEEAKDSADIRTLYMIKGELLYMDKRENESRGYLRLSMKSKNRTERLKSYFGLYHIYRKRNQIDSSYYFADALVLLQDSASKDYVNESLVSLKSIQSYKKQRRSFIENKIEMSQHKSQLAYILIAFLIITLLLLLTVVIYRNRKVKLETSVKEEQSKLIEIELQKREIENQLLKEQAEKENERLKSLAADLYRKDAENLLLKEKNEKEILLARDMVIKAEYYKRLNMISIPILSARKDNKGFIFLGKKEWATIKNNTNACFENFTDRLADTFPVLSEDDICFLCLIKMELSLDLLASVYHVEKNSISKKKGRMKDKMNIRDKSLDDFIRVF
ncbi:MAG: hypothetical protein ACRCX4_00385 [Bacteroidales bacterium]